jgi:hypothetical protein
MEGTLLPEGGERVLVLDLGDEAGSALAAAALSAGAASLPAFASFATLAALPWAGIVALAARGRLVEADLEAELQVGGLLRLELLLRELLANLLLGGDGENVLVLALLDHLGLDGAVDGDGALADVVARKEGVALLLLRLLVLLKGQRLQHDDNPI